MEKTKIVGTEKNNKVRKNHERKEPEDRAEAKQTNEEKHMAQDPLSTNAKLQYNLNR